MYDTEHKVGNDIYSARLSSKIPARIGNGGNNKIFSFLNRGEKFCIKYYFQSVIQGNRLRAEWSFLSFLQKCGFAFCPQPIFKDAIKQFVIMSLIEGKSLNQSHSGEFISSFCNFFNFINSEENRNLGRDLNVASEGAFDASSHIAISEQKFIKLKNCLHVKSALMFMKLKTSWLKLK